MVSSTLFPAVHNLGSQNVYGRAEGIADHYWPWAVFYSIGQFRPSRSVCLSNHLSGFNTVCPFIQLSVSFNERLVNS